MPINVFDNVDRTFLTVILIVCLTAVLYRFMGRFNKPLVLGGLLAGGILANLHLPKEYFDLNSCSELGDMGIVLFMMILGLRFDFSIVREKKTNLLISFGSILLPLVLGLWFAQYIYPLNAGVESNIQLPQFSLLCGLAMSIAAFSLVSLFLSHAHVLHHKIAHVGLLAAGTDDVVFWLIFGAILVYFQTNDILKINEGLIFSIYLVFLFLVFPRLVRFIVNRIFDARVMLGFIIIGCFASSILADAVDLHQVFGAFVFGLMLPRNNEMINQIQQRINDLVNVILLPIFFAKIGAIADINIVTDTKIIWYALVAVVIAFSGKFIGAYVCSRLLGYKKSESAFLASILNIRGVVEIVMMKVAWEVGLISLPVFTIFIIMALVTTWIATSSALLFKKLLPKDGLKYIRPPAG